MVEVKRELVQVLGLIILSALVLNNEVLFQCFQEFLACHTIEIFHHTVIVENGKLRGLEANCHEIVVLLVTLMVGVLFALFCSNKSCSC